MTTVIAEVYEALIEAGASQEKAKKAAEALTGYENRFNWIDRKLVKIEGDIVFLKWMLGLVMAGTCSLIVKTFFA